jgi:hypothetical protein
MNSAIAPMKQASATMVAASSPAVPLPFSYPGLPQGAIHQQLVSCARSSVNMSGAILVLAMTQEALPALSNQNDEEAARDEKGPEIFILSLAQDTSAGKRK